MNRTRTLIAVATGLALNIAGVGTAFASTGDDRAELRVVVRYADAELATAEGLRQVQRRMLAAVDEVCPAADVRDPERRAQVDACRAQAIARAVAQIKNPQLAAVLAVSTHQG